MTSAPFEIHLPCDVLTVKVRVGPQEHLSGLEELFLRAVHGGMTSFQQLVRLFGVGHRPTLDVVFDLWHRGYLVLDLAHGAVSLASRVSHLISEGQLAELSSGEATDEVRQVMLDKLTGHVLPVRGRRSPPNGRSVVPTEHFDVGPLDISTSDLLSALRQLVDVEERLGRAKKVLSAHLSLTELLVTPERRWLSLYITCAQDDDTNGLSVQVVDGGDLPSSVRTTIGERVALLVDDLPDSVFTKYLRALAGRGAPNLPDIDDSLSRLESTISGLRDLDVGLLPQRHQQLNELAETVEEWSAERRGAEIDLQIQVGQDRHQDALRALIDGADRQLILACPWIAYSAVQPLLAPLRAALDRGVQVYLLWGIKPDDVLDQQVRNALLHLRTEFPARLFVSSQSSRTHAKVIVQDDRAALVTSSNFLSPSHAETFELGVLLKARGSDARCTAIEGLLDWARSVYPEFTGAQSMYLTREDFVPDRADSSAPSAEATRPVQPNLESELAPEPAKEFEAVAATLWRLSWSDYYQELRQGTAARTVAGRVLRDGQHREMLWRALRGAKRRLLIASDQLGPEVVDDRFLRTLEDRLRGGVLVTLLYRRPSQHAGFGGADPEGALAALESRFKGRLRLLPNQATHAKAVVVDDVAVISSFNFLSFEGFYEERRPGLRRRQRSEVGIAVSGGDAAESVIAAIGDVFSTAVESWPRREEKPLEHEASCLMAPSWTPAEQQRFISTLFAAADTADQAAILREALSSSIDPTSMLDRLDVAQLPEELLRIGVAAYLSARTLAPSKEVEARWLRWLLELCWRRRDFVEAALVASAFPEISSESVPRPQIVALAAAHGSASFGKVLEDVATSNELGETESAVVAKLALVDVMLRGTTEAWAAVHAHRSALPPSWQRTLAAFENYWNQTYEPLPIERMRAELDAAEHQQEVDLSWRELERALDRGAVEHFKFESGTKTREHLYHPNGSLGRLRTLAVKRDGGGVRTWLTVEGVDDMDSFLDATTAQATGRNDQAIERGKRRSYVRLLESIVSAARSVAVLSADTVTRDESRRIDLGRQVARVIRSEWSALEKDVVGTPEPHGVILRMALDEIRPIAEWGSR